MSVDKTEGLQTPTQQTASSSTTPPSDLAGGADRGRGIATDGGRSRFEDGPRECPYEEDYQHWVADGLLVVHGHPVGVVCDCGDAMTFDAFYGGHNETAGFTCGCGLAFVLAPAKCTPDHWECFADGGQETTFLLADDGEYHFGLERENADDLIFRVQATTMPDDEPEVATDGGTTEPPTIAFDDDHIERILTGEKTVTVRYEFEPDLAPMERVQLVTADGEAFATARVTTQCELRADWIAYGVFAGHRTYKTTQDLLDELAGYYPDAEFRPGTVLDVLAFQVERQIDQSADNDEWDFPSFDPLDRDDLEHVGDANELADDEYDRVDALGHAYVHVEPRLDDHGVGGETA